VDTDSDGRADAAHVLIRGLDHPNGVVWLGGSLFVQTTRQLLRYDVIDAFALAGKVTEMTEMVNPMPCALMCILKAPCESFHNSVCLLCLLCLLCLASRSLNVCPASCSSSVAAGAAKARAGQRLPEGHRPARPCLEVHGGGARWPPVHRRRLAVRQVNRYSARHMICALLLQVILMPPAGPSLQAA